MLNTGSWVNSDPVKTGRIVSSGYNRNMWRIQVLMAICVTLGVALASKSLAEGTPGPIAIVPALAATGTAKPGPGMFLVARRALDGSYFEQSVVYLVEHGEDGTLGLIVNRPLRSKHATVSIRRRFIRG